MRPLLYILLALFIEMLIIGSFASKAFSQSVDNQARPLMMSEHPQHASAVVLSTGGDVVVVSGGSNTNIPAPPPEEPLGDVARRYRALRDAAPKPHVQAREQ